MSFGVFVAILPNGLCAYGRVFCVGLFFGHKTIRGFSV